MKNALLIGIAQGIAVAPGYFAFRCNYRDCGYFGIKTQDAAEFSFLIGIPAMTVAAGPDLSGRAGFRDGVYTAGCCNYRCIYCRLCKYWYIDEDF